MVGSGPPRPAPSAQFLRRRLELLLPEVFGGVRLDPDDVRRTAPLPARLEPELRVVTDRLVRDVVARLVERRTGALRVVTLREGVDRRTADDRFTLLRCGVTLRVLVDGGRIAPREPEAEPRAGVARLIVVLGRACVALLRLDGGVTLRCG